MKLTHSWRRSLSYKDQSINLLWKWMDWGRYDRELRHERFNQRQGASTWFFKLSLNVFLPNVSFWSPWKHQKTKGFLRIFQGNQRGILGRNELKKKTTYSQDKNFGIFYFFKLEFTLRKAEQSLWGMELQ